MAITYVGEGTYIYTISSPSVPPPASLMANDLLILIIESENNQPAVPAGWTNIGGMDSPYVNAFVRVCYKWTTGTEGNAAVGDSGSSTRAIMCAFRGVDIATPFDNGLVADSEAELTTVSIANVTTVTAACMIVNCVGYFYSDADGSYCDSWANAALASITEGHDQNDSAGTGGGIAFAYGIKAASGATADTTFNTTAQEQAMISFALRPGAVAGNSANFSTFF